jgi:hypothetical protein
MFKKFLFIISVSFFFSQFTFAEKVIIFDFTDDEFKTLKVKKVKGEISWSLGFRV